MQKKVVFGLIGAKTCGKSTVSKLIQQIYKQYIDDKPFTESMLAGKLKETCANVWKMNPIIFEDQRYKELPFKWWNIYPTLRYGQVEEILKAYGFDPNPLQEHWKVLTPLLGTELDSPRQILQFVGTEILRALGDPDIHCKTVKLGDRSIISDTRFLNEYEFFSKDPNVEFHAIYIKRDEAENKVDKYMAHRSETEYHQFKDKCHLLDNNGDLVALKTNIMNLLFKINNLNKQP